MTDNPNEPPPSQSHPSEPLRRSKLAWIPVFLLALLLVFTLVSGSELRKMFDELDASLPLLSEFALGWRIITVEIGFLLLAVMAACLIRKRSLQIASQVGFLLAFVVLTAVYLCGALLAFFAKVQNMS